MVNIKEINTDLGMVKVWKMNYGFKSDMNGYIANIDNDVKGKKSNTKININIGNMRLYWLVFGIYECSSAGILEPKDIESGLSQLEIETRYKKVRTLEGDVAEQIYNAILDLNKGPSEREEDDIKKD